MPEVKLGTKFECFNCSTKFYDLGKPEPVCPKCGANQKDASHGKEAPAASQASRRKRKADVVRPIEPVEEEETVEGVLPEDEIETPEIDEDVEEEEEEFEDEA